MNDQNRNKDKPQDPSTQKQHSQQQPDTRHDTKNMPDQDRSKHQHSGGSGQGQQGGRGSDNR